MSRSTDWEDASPFAWIFGSALAFVALGVLTRAILDRRVQQTPTVRPSDGSEDETLAGHPS